MTGKMSGADISTLYRYSDVALRLDYELMSEVNKLASVLHSFEASCIEFPVSAAFLASNLRDYARWMEPTDRWVGMVAKNFWIADKSAGFLEGAEDIVGVIVGVSSKAGTHYLGQINVSFKWINSIGLTPTQLRKFLDIRMPHAHIEKVLGKIKKIGRIAAVLAVVVKWAGDIRDYKGWELVGALGADLVLTLGKIKIAGWVGGTLAGILAGAGFISGGWIIVVGVGIAVVAGWALDELDQKFKVREHIIEGVKWLGEEGLPEAKKKVEEGIGWLDDHVFGPTAEAIVDGTKKLVTTVDDAADRVVEQFNMVKQGIVDGLRLARDVTRAAHDVLRTIERLRHIVDQGSRQLVANLMTGPHLHYALAGAGGVGAVVAANNWQDLQPRKIANSALSVIQSVSMNDRLRETIFPKYRSPLAAGAAFVVPKLMSLVRPPVAYASEPLITPAALASQNVSVEGSSDVLERIDTLSKLEAKFVPFSQILSRQEELKNAISLADSELENLREAIVPMEADLADVAKTKADLQEQLKALQDERDNFWNNILPSEQGLKLGFDDRFLDAPWRTKSDDLEEKIADLERQIEQMTIEEVKLQTDLQKNQDLYDQTTQGRDKIQQNLQNLEKKQINGIRFDGPTKVNGSPPRLFGCTYYAASKRELDWGPPFGNAGDWDNNAGKTYDIGKTPIQGAIVVFDPESDYGHEKWGHVAVVEAVDWDSESIRIKISEGNYLEGQQVGPGEITAPHWITIPADQLPYVNFIYEKKDV